MRESQPVWGTPPEIQHDGVKLHGNCSPCSSLTQCEGTPSSDRTRLLPPPPPPTAPPPPDSMTSVSMVLSRYDLARCSLQCSADGVFVGEGQGFGPPFSSWLTE